MFPVCSAVSSLSVLLRLQLSTLYSFPSRLSFIFVHLLPATMAPLLASGIWDYRGSDFVRRALSSPIEPTIIFTPHQQYVAQVLALTAASISIVASMITSYWFLKMRRTFRHQ